MSEFDEEDFVDASREDTEDFYFDSRQGSANMMVDGTSGPQHGSGGGNASPPISQYGLTLTTCQAYNRLMNDAKQLSDITYTSLTVSTALLKHFQWSLTRAKDRFFDVRDKLFATLKLNEESCRIEPETMTNDTEVSCGICFDDCKPGSAIALLSCHHWVCVGCAREHLLFVLLGKGHIIEKRCFVGDCLFFVGPALFAALLSPEEFSTLYKTVVVREYLEDNTLMRWCANPRGQCDRVIVVGFNKDRNHEVRCDACSTRFCFNCGDDAHAPATCDMLRMWRKKAADDSETANWVAANTKACPKCRKSTEKNGGCNHMTCSCRYEWCWICEGDWSKHGTSYYKCNFYDSSAKTEKDKFRDSAKDSLQRYIFYFSRYANHLASQRLDAVVLAKVQKRIVAELEADKTSVTSSRYLEDTAQVLFDCRHTLMYTYVYSFYLTNECEKQLFEYQQARLELSTEELSEVIEGSKVLEAQVVVDKTAIAKKFHTEMAKGVWSQDK